MAIRVADFEKDIQPLVNGAKKAGVSMYNPPGAVWFCGEDDGRVYSCGCIVVNDKTKAARWKSDFTLPEYRGRGTYKRMLKLKLLYCMKRQVKKITAFVGPLNLNVLLGMGFTMVSKPKADVFYLLKEL